jgi:transposase
VSVLYVGIDVSKRKHDASLVSAEGEEIGQPLSFPNTQEGVDRLLARVDRQGAERVIFGLEATGHYWLPLYAALTAAGRDVKVINPIQSDSLRNLYIRVTKNDRKDAFLIAQVVRFGQFTETRLAEEPIMQLRELSRLRVELSESVADLKRRTTGLLDRVFPEFERHFSDPFGATAMKVLSTFSTPKDLADADLDELTELLLHTSRGRIGKDRAEALQEAARRSFGIVYGLDAFTLEIRLLLAQIAFISSQVEQLDGRLEELMRDHQLILSIPGIGPTLGAAILGEIGDIHRFPDAKHLRAYAGLDATVHQSGQFNGTQSRISKRGSPYLRRAFWYAASVARIHDLHWRSVYEEKIRQGKAPNQAVTIVASRLCNVVFAVLSSGQAYDPQRYAPSPLTT